MPASKRKKTPSKPPATETPDVGELLRASIHAENLDEQPLPSTLPEGGEDIQKLLREQTARFLQDAASVLVSNTLDTSDFESETDVTHTDTAPEEPTETIPVEPAETIPEEPTDTIPEEPADTIPEEPAETDAESISDALSKASNRSVDHEAPGVSRGGAHSTHKVLPSDFDRPARSTSDIRLNGQEEHSLTERAISPADMGVSTDRRRMTREQNDVMLREFANRRAASEEPGVTRAEPSKPMASTRTVPKPQEEPESTPLLRPRRDAISYDPLQIGYGGSSKRIGRMKELRSLGISASRESIESVEAPLMRSKEYTAAMPSPEPMEVRKRESTLLDDLGYGAEMHHAEDRRAIEQAHSEAARQTVDQQELDTRVLPNQDEDRTVTRLDVHPGEAAEKRHRRVRRTRVLRLIAAFGGTLLMLLYDCLPWLCRIGMENGVPDFFKTEWYPILGLALTAVFVIPFATRLRKGLAGLGRFAPNRYSTAALSVLTHALYTGFVAVACSLGAEPTSLFGGLSLMTLAIAVLSEQLDAMGEWAAYDLLSVGKPIYTLTDEVTSATLSYQEDGLQGSSPLTAIRTRSADRAFARMGAYPSYMGRLNYLLPAAGGLAMICTGITLAMRGGQLLNAVRLLTVTFLSLLPAAYLIAMSLPILRANRQLSDSGCAVLGAAAPDLYAARTHNEREVYFYDREIIRAVRRRELQPYPSENAGALPIEHWRSMANRLFHLMQSPLATELSFENDSSPEILYPLHAEIAERREYFLRLYIIDETPYAEKTIEVMMGSYEELASHGVRLPPRAKEKEYCRGKNSQILYIAFDGHFRIGYAAEYRVRKDFQTMLKALAQSHAKPVMVTYNPLLSMFTLADARFKVLREASVEIVHPDRIEIARNTCPGAVVSLDSGYDLIHPLAACHGMGHCYSLSYLLTWGSMFGTAALILIATLLGKDHYINTLTVTLLQLLFAAVTAILPLPILSRKALHLPPREKQRLARRRGGKKTPQPDQDQSKQTKETS